MTHEQERILMARIMASLMGGPGMAVLLKGISTMSWDTIWFGFGWVAVAHGWFLLLSINPNKKEE